MVIYLEDALRGVRATESEPDGVTGCNRAPRAAGSPAGIRRAVEASPGEPARTPLSALERGGPRRDLLTLPRVPSGAGFARVAPPPLSSAPLTDPAVPLAAAAGLLSLPPRRWRGALQ